MPKPSKSQWEFGELFPVGSTRKVLSVGELTSQVRTLLEKQIGRVWVAGEISNFKPQMSGHLYFTLKDADSQVNCVLFRSEPVAHRELLDNGRNVILQGDLTVYEPRGQYQMRVCAIELQGLGALQAAFEALKLKLKAEGLFDRKRLIPRIPKRLGIVTSHTGAAIRDVLQVIQRRNPSLEIILSHCRVQGHGAAGEVACSIELLNQFNKISSPDRQVDLILVTRGGGSLEDLWTFNEEDVARAIYASDIPVISAIGHEIDFTIADFVADLRAPTPSIAAELITNEAVAVQQLTRQLQHRIRQLTWAAWASKTETFKYFQRRFISVSPRRQIESLGQRVDELSETMIRSFHRLMQDRRKDFSVMADRLQRLRPLSMLTQRKEKISALGRRLDSSYRTAVSHHRSRFNAAVAHLRLLGPSQTLARGYSITVAESTGKVVADGLALKKGETIKTVLKNSTVRSTVIDVQAKSPLG